MEALLHYLIDSVGFGGSALFPEGVDVDKFSSNNNCEFLGGDFSFATICSGPDQRFVP